MNNINEDLGTIDIRTAVLGAIIIDTNYNTSSKCDEPWIYPSDVENFYSKYINIEGSKSLSLFPMWYTGLAQTKTGYSSYKYINSLDTVELFNKNSILTTDQLFTSRSKEYVNTLFNSIDPRFAKDTPKTDNTYFKSLMHRQLITDKWVNNDISIKYAVVRKGSASQSVERDLVFLIGGNDIVSEDLFEHINTTNYINDEVNVWNPNDLVDDTDILSKSVRFHRMLLGATLIYNQLKYIKDSVGITTIIEFGNDCEHIIRNIDDIIYKYNLLRKYAIMYETLYLNLRENI